MTLTTAQKRDALCRTSAQRCYRWGGIDHGSMIAIRTSIPNGLIVLDVRRNHKGKS